MYDQLDIFGNVQTVHDDRKSTKTADYGEFVEKYMPKLTTDDCYTPPLVYDAIADYVANRYHLAKDRFVRPFYPGGNYQAYEYQPGDVVVDNPPFSILSKICQWYAENGIEYFLFAPSLTLFSNGGCSAERVSYVQARISCMRTGHPSKQALSQRWSLVRG